MGRDAANMEDLHVVPAKQLGQAADGIVAKVLVIDRVVLQRADEISEIVVLGDEDAARRQQVEDAAHHAMHIADMGEDIGRGDHPRRPEIGLRRLRRRFAEEGNASANAALVGDIAGPGRLDPQDLVPAGDEVAEQGAVIRTDIDHQVLGAELHLGLNLAIEVGEQGIAGLLDRPRADARHAVHRRHIGEEQDRGQVRAAADLAFRDRPRGGFAHTRSEAGCRWRWRTYHSTTGPMPLSKLTRGTKP